MSNEKPKIVRDAQLRGDSEALSNMGRKGVSRKIQLEDLKKAGEQAERERLEAEQAKLYSTNKEGDVLPPESPSTEE
ncbi:MAG TPA: hypothetical protein VMV50_00165 [Candidatus Paceibacterota bacterium]|nr:hypothetical protein [Candidatus Paceibacterota bacterium]